MPSRVWSFPEAVPDLVRAEPSLASGFLHISDSLRHGVTEVLDLNQSAQTFSFQQPVAALADDAHQPALPFDPSQAVLVDHLPRPVDFHRCFPTAGVKVNILRLQSDGQAGPDPLLDKTESQLRQEAELLMSCQR